MNASLPPGPVEATAHSAQEFHLFVANAAPPAAGCPPAAAPSPLVVASSVASLLWSRGGEARLSPAAGSAPKTAPKLEPLVSRTSQPRLLLISPPGRRARVNGVLAPRVAILAEADRFHFADSVSFRVAIYHRPHLGPVSGALAGTSCNICSTPLQAAERCLTCPCGAAMHAAEDESREGALACVKMASECPRCQRPIRLEPGYGELSLSSHD